MTDNVKTLFPGQPNPSEPDGEVVAILERMLAEAKSGGLRGIALAGTYADGSVATTVICTHDPFALLGALHHLQSRINDCIER